VEDWTEDDWMEWIEDLYEALDAKNVEAFVAKLTPGAEVRFGNGEPVEGRVAVRDAYTEFFRSIDSVSHAFTSQLRVDDTLIVEQAVTYGRRDGTAIVVPAVTIFELTDGMADRMQTYTDVSPLFPSDNVPALCKPGEAVMA
jgi:hypothetical protein